MLPGFGFASARYSFRFFAGSEGVTTMMFCSDTTIPTGARSFCTSYGTLVIDRADHERADVAEADRVTVRARRA